MELDGPGPCGKFGCCIRDARSFVTRPLVAATSRHPNDAQPASPEPFPRVHQVPLACVGDPALRRAPHMGLHLTLWPVVCGKHALSQWRLGVPDVGCV